MLEINPTSRAAVVLVSGLAGVFRVAFGFGAGVFLAPILALVLPPEVAVALMAPLMLVTDLSALHHHWRKWHVRHVPTSLPACFAGVVAGSLLLGRAPSEAVR